MVDTRGRKSLVYLALYRAAARNERDERRRARIDYAHSRARARALDSCGHVIMQSRSSVDSFLRRVVSRGSHSSAASAGKRRVHARAADLQSNDFALSKIGYTEID